jgi:hypothetical protein
MHEDGFGETNGFASSSLDPCPQRPMFAFALVGVAFADSMGSRRQVPPIDAGGIGIKVHQPKRLQHLR